MNNAEVERALLEVAQKQIVGADPYLALKGRFTRDAFIPMVNWVADELVRPSRQDADLLAVYVAGIGLVLASLTKQTLRPSQHTLTTVEKVFLDEFRGHFR